MIAAPRVAALPPLKALRIWDAALVVLRAEPALFGTLALLGYAPLAVAAALAARVDAADGLGAHGASTDVNVALAFSLAVALGVRAVAHGALLVALQRRLAGEPITPWRALRENGARAFDCALAGGVVSLFGVLSGLAAFAPAIVFGGLFVGVLPRVVYRQEGLSGAFLHGATGRGFAVSFVGWLLVVLLLCNLALFVQVGLGCARIFFDADVGFANALLSFENRTYVVSLALVAFGLCEPLRVIAAGLTSLEAVSRPHGLDLRARLDALPSFAPRDRGPRAASS